ncbi:MAG: hypothetical protein NXY57DRAFT_1044832 [Lentinula lateritia]|nr:MAG: hypothetical protein NXY57DRAFT_1044832 [Lentinula lateritia]
MTKGRALPEQLCWTVLRLSELHNPLEIQGFTQLTQKAIERSAIKRAKYIALIGLRYTSEQLVFAIGGQRATRSAFFVRGRHTGILTVDIVEGSYNNLRFRKFIDGLLSQMNP